MPDSGLHYATVSNLNHTRATSVWDWVAGDGARPDQLPVDLRWLHATFDDGLVWGAFRDGRWAAGRGYGAAVPELRVGALWELRLFGPDAEVLIWPEDDLVGHGQLAGRVLLDATTEDPAETTLEPIDEQRLLFGDRLVPHSANGSGFSLIGDATGARQIVPLDLGDDLFADGRWMPATLSIRQYLQTDEATNTLRIAATRFLDLFHTNPPEAS